MRDAGGAAAPAHTRGSIEIRKTHDGNEFECDWGTFVHSRPRPHRGETDRLMLANREWIHELIRRQAAGLGDDGREAPSIVHVRLVCADEHLTPDSEIAIYLDLEFGCQTWTWQLFDAHWWDGPHPGVYVGRWPD